MKQITKAVLALHNHKIVHLDINLSNIVIDRSRQNFKLIDYGSS